MPRNEPGRNGNNETPPELDKLLNDFLYKVRGLLLTKKNSSDNWKVPNEHHPCALIASLVGVVILIVWFISGFYIVNPAEQAVILNFGKFANIEQPGLHWYARFFETKYAVDMQKIYSFALQGDFLTKSSEQSDIATQSSQFQTIKDVSGVKNLVHVELNVQYRIEDPEAYLFNVVNPDDTVQQVASGALSAVIGTMKLDEVLTTGRETLDSDVLNRTKEILKNYNAGLKVIAVTLRKVQTPDQDRSAYIQQAEAYASKAIPLDAQRVASSKN